MDHPRDHQSVRRLDLDRSGFALSTLLLGNASLLYCVVILANIGKTGCRKCPINDDLLPIGL
jgi:hypothetical protein